MPFFDTNTHHSYEDALWNALGLFDLYKNQKVDNLGDPSALLKQFEKQLYLSKSIVRTATANKNEYSLGPRSLVEFGRKMLFRAVGEVRLYPFFVCFGER
jgi:hypothetical protein